MKEHTKKTPANKSKKPDSLIELLERLPEKEGRALINIYRTTYMECLANEEADKLLPQLKTTYPQLKDISIVYIACDVPKDEMLKYGISAEADSYYDADTKKLFMFLLNIEKRAKPLDEYREAIRTDLPFLV